MVGWTSSQIEGHGRKQAKDQSRTSGSQPTHPTPPNQVPQWFSRNKDRQKFYSETGSNYINLEFVCLPFSCKRDTR